MSRKFGVLALAAIAGCGSTSSAFLERFPVAPVWVCDEVTTHDGTSTRDRTEEACRVEGDRILCTTRSLTSSKPLGSGEERIGEHGILTVGNQSTRYDPPPLSLPFDIAPGREWQIETIEVGLDGTPGAGSRGHQSKSFSVLASADCEGGLLIKSVRRGPAGDPIRFEAETLLCPGSSSPRTWNRRAYDGKELLWTVTGSCGSR